MISKRMGIVTWDMIGFTITVDLHDVDWIREEAPFGEYIFDAVSLGKGVRWQIEFARLINMEDALSAYQRYEASPNNKVQTS